jgi:hypothetical protein
MTRSRQRLAGDADAVEQAADQLPVVGHQHESVGLLDRERGDQAADLVLDGLGALLAFPDRHRDDAAAAAARQQVSDR